MPRSSSVAFRNDQLKGVNQSSSVPVGLTLMKLFPKFIPPTSPLNEPFPVSAVEVAGGIGGQPSAGLPDAAEAAVGRGVVHHDLLQARRIVAEDPAVVGTLVAVRRPRDVDGAVIEQERRRADSGFSR